MVKQGYKQTEIGVIPEDWEIKKLKEVGGFLSTNSLSRDKLNYNQGVFYNIHYGDIHTLFNSHFDIENELVPFINNDIKLSTINLCRIGDLIIADASENDDDIGKAIEIINDDNKNIVAGLHTLHFRPVHQIFYNGFLGHLWKAEFMHTNILKEAQGTKVLGISINRLLDIQIPLLPLAEQEAIALALSDTDAWIESLEQLIAKKHLIKQGAMQSLLTPKKDWEVKKLGEVFKLKQGVQCGIEHQLLTTKEGFKRFIRIVDLTQKNTEKRYIKDPGLEHHISENDLFMVRYGAPGVVGYGVNGVIANNLFRLIPKIELVELYFKYVFYFMKSYLEEISSSSTMAALNFTTLNNIDLYFPKSLSEQTRIATILSDMDAELAALEKQLAKARQIKQGMMQELLTGRVRLV
ncbi:restriction endonuclease subunit S [Myroides odoratimimus]|uniref:restriction endonuclease subunit S n=1 Tax=Myroides odoratimimus TaxID=76832 RepID=UPI0025760117|nr:restriction endonuclease subunit S [Myroides odoratimimus]MDM1442786.1 restriction endonuclease subunit S [Myroides odoratimimus]